VPNQCLLEWNLPEDGELTEGGSETPRFKTAVFFDFDEGDTQAQAERRLSNLGYTRSQKFSDNLSEFQRSQGLKVSGTLDDAPDARLREVHEKLSPPA